MSVSSIWKIAASDPDRLAIIAPDGSELNYEELAASSNQVSRGLLDLGLTTGDRLAIVMRNSPALIEVVLAAMQNGLYIVPINFHSTASDIAYIVQDSDARAVITDPQLSPVCSEALDDLSFPSTARICTGEAVGFRNYYQWRDGNSTTRPEPTFAGAVMNYTSGTTGHPKGILRPLPDVDADTGANQLIWILTVFGVTVGPGVHLVNSPLYHTAVINLAVAAVHSGQALALMDDWEPELALQLIARHRVTSSHMVATLFHRFLSLPEDVRNRYDVSSLEHVIHGAVSTPVDIKKRMLDWWGPVIYEYYGSSEVGGTIASPTHWLEKPGTVGRPFPITQIKILDDDGDPVPVGEPGWIYMCQGEDVFEYHKDPGKTDRRSRGKFICVGDIGYLDEDGDLFLCGRDAEIIISGGVNIYPAAVEGHLFSHPAVDDVAVVGVPDEEFGEQVKAVVVAKPGYVAGDSLENLLIEFCRDSLSHFTCPRSVDFVDSLPRDPSGKLYKQQVRDSYWQGHEKLI